MTDADTFDPAQISWVLTDRNLDHLLAVIDQSEEVVLDLETTGLDEWATGLDPAWPCPARVSMISLTLPLKGEDYLPGTYEPTTYVVPLSHPEGPWQGKWRETLRQIAQRILDSSIPVTNQNLAFDMRWINATTGVDLSSLFAWDTMIGSHLLDENSSTRLKEVVPRLFGIDRWDEGVALSTPGASERVPLFDLGVYAARDTYWVWRLAEHQRYRMFVSKYSDEPPLTDEEWEESRLGQLAVWCAMPTSSTLTQIMERGVRVDLAWVRDRLAAQELISETLYGQLAGLYPDLDAEGRSPSFAPTSLYFRDWSAASVKAGDLRVAALTPNGNPQWSKEVLTRQAALGSRVAEQLLAYRSAVKEQEFLRSWLSFATPDGTIHTTYNAGRVKTGRLSSSDPNMQQVTKRLRPAFIPRPGYLLADLDYSQVELRVAAFISRCQAMLDAYQRGEDLHRVTATLVSGKPLESITGGDRQNAKAAGFGLLYGMGADGYRDYAETTYGVNLTPEQAQEQRLAFFSGYPELTAWHEDSVRAAEKNGQVVSPLGRVRRLPDIWDANPSVSGHAERQAINFPVQSFASDLMMLAASSIAGNLPGHDPVPDVHLVATVHDSIVVEVPADDWQRATARCMRRMLHLGTVLSRMGCEFDVPLGVDASVGTRWGLGDVGEITG